MKHGPWFNTKNAALNHIGLVTQITSLFLLFGTFASANFLMMLSQIYIDNLKCGGCATTIVTELQKLSDVQKVQIDSEHDLVLVETREDSDLNIVKDKLKSLGYPEKNSVHGFEKLSTHAKSYLSCAIGKLNNNISLQ